MILVPPGPRGYCPGGSKTWTPDRSVIISEQKGKTSEHNNTTTEESLSTFPIQRKNEAA
jgi:hypothetical protein